MSDLNTVLNSLSDEQLQLIESGQMDQLDDQTLQYIADPSSFNPNAEPQAPQGTKNLAGAIQGFFPSLNLSDEQAEAVAGSGPAKLLQGVGREADAITRGIQQMAGSEEEAKALEAIEKRDRKIYEEIDAQGIGMEDLGQAVPALASIILPGAPAVQAVGAVGKGLGFLRTVGSTLGGQAAMIGAIEGSKAIVDDESRGMNAAEAAGATLLGGKAFNMLGNSAHFGTIGKLLAAGGFGVMAKGEAGRRTRGAVASWIMRNLFGRVPKDATEAARIQAAKAIGGPESRRMVEQTTKARLNEAARSSDAPTRAASWEGFLDLVQGPKNPKTGKRMVGKSIGGAAGAPKAAKEAGIDVAAERNRMISMLMEGSKKPNPDNPAEILFDLDGMAKQWADIKKMPEFANVYHTNTGKLNSKAKAVDEWIEAQLVRGSPQSKDEWYQRVMAEGHDLMRKHSREAIDNVNKETQPLVDKGLKMTEAQVSRRAAAANLATLVDQNGGFGETYERVMSGDDFTEFMDWTSQVQELVTQLWNEM